MNEIRLRWFDAHLRGIEPSAVSETPAVTYFRMGGGGGARDSNDRLVHGGRWREAELWPPAGGSVLNLQLTADGMLSGDEVRTSGARKLPVDVRKPVPSVGGSIKNPDIIPGFFVEGGRDQRESDLVMDSPGSNLPLSARRDVAAFRSDVLESDTDISGPLFVELWVSSTSPACDLSLKIVDEYPASDDWPEGFALNIADSFQRFASWTRELSIDPSQPTRVVVGPIHVSNLFAAGHRIRLDISNSSWPRFDRNHEAHETYEFTVHFGGDVASRLYGDGVRHATVPKESQ